MSGKETLSSSMEDYLEAIYHIVGEKQAARAKDIATRLKVNNSSVTGALRSLSEKGYINYAPYDLITLTPKGKKHAETVVRKHEALLDFFVKVLGIQEEEAENAACEMEHALSQPILEKLIRFIEFVEICPRAGDKWLEGFGVHCLEGEAEMEDCQKCLNACLEEVKKKMEDRETSPQKTVYLDDLEPGQRGRIVRIKGRGDIRRKMTDMGVSAGSIIEVEEMDSENDSVEVKVRGYHLSLRRDEAHGIAVEDLQ